MFNRLDRMYKTKEIPRFDQAKIDEHLAPFLKYPIVPTVPFADIINRAEVKNWLPVEEALYKHWCIDRLACIGDSVHKVRRIQYSKGHQERLANMIPDDSQCRTGCQLRYRNRRLTRKQH